MYDYITSIQMLLRYLFIGIMCCNVVYAEEVLPDNLSLESASYKTVSINDLLSVSDLDIARYLGKWLEIARLPNYFENRCHAPVVLDLIGEDDQITFDNSCMSISGSIITANSGVIYISSENMKGSGKFVRSSMPSWLRWTGLGRSDYWVIYNDYSYTMLGTPDHKYLWIYSRNENPPLSMIQNLLEIAQNQGFEISQVIFNYPSYYAK